MECPLSLYHKTEFSSLMREVQEKVYIDPDNSSQEFYATGTDPYQGFN